MAIAAATRTSVPVMTQRVNLQASKMQVSPASNSTFMAGIKIESSKRPVLQTSARRAVTVTARGTTQGKQVQVRSALHI